MERKLVTVAVDGSAEFTTLTAAAAAQDPAQPLHFVLGAGTYYERPFLELADYIITGAGMGQTVISAGAAGRDPWPGEERTGTFRSQTLFLGGGSARLEHLTVENTAGDGADRGQALAVYADASRVCMVDVSLHGNQDTLFTAPLPLAVRQKNGFRGPRENTPRLDTVQYYKNCTIRGNIDFIFGGANAVFDTCRLEPWHHISGTCYITAPSTPAGKPGYLFVNCTVQGSCAPGSVYLGRPWRADAACYWLDCALSDEVCADGWDNWRDPENEKTARFGEHGSTGPGSAAKRAFGSVDDDNEANAQREMYARVKAEFGVE